MRAWLMVRLQQQIFDKMSRSGLGDPQKFQLASIVTKNSRTGITSNRRLLVVRGGHMYYYSNIPKSFTGDNIKVLDQFHELPKCSIDIVKISRVNGFEPSSSYFSIEFEAKHMLEREDIRKTLVNEDYNFTPKNTKELVTWQFTCDNQFIKQKWVSALLNLKDYFRNEQANIQKYFDSIHNPPSEEQKSSNGSFSSRSSLKVSPWMDNTATRGSFGKSKYGFEFKEGSPRENSNRIEEPHFLKKGKSEDPRSFPPPEFEMIIEEDPKPAKIEEAFKVFQVKKEEPAKEQTKAAFPAPPPVIEEAIDEASLSQTPIKENSYSDSQQQIERRASMEKTLNDFKLFSETHQLYFEAQEPRPTQLVPPLEIAEERSEMKNSKISGEFYNTPRSNFEARSVESQERASKVSSGEKGCVAGSEFEWLLGESCKSASSFELRLQRQKELMGLLEAFKQKALAGFADWLQSKAREEEKYRVVEQSSQVKLVDIGNIQFKIASLTTQNIQINGRQKIFFNEDAIKNLKREFKVYQNLCRTVMKALRHQPALALRLPLALYIEYKGVTCIAFEQAEVEQPAEFAADEELWQAERSLLQEEGYKLEWFNFKTRGDYLIGYVRTRGKHIEKDEENLREHLKRMMKAGGREKNHNIVFESPIDRTFLEIARKEQASTSAESLERYVKGLRMAKTLHGTCPKEEIIAALECCLYCKQLRKVYRSAQGEIEETHFFNLVFKHDPSIAALLEQASCAPPNNLRGQLFSFIEHYFGVVLEVDAKAFEESCLGRGRKKKDLFFSSTVSPLIREYPFSQLEIVESYSKLPVYLQSRHHLTEAALAKKKEMFHLRGQNLSAAESLQLLYDEASFFYCEADFIGCIKKCREYEQVCPHQYSKLFAVYLLMMKAYSEFSEADFSLTFKKATELIEYNYGPEHSSLISLFSLAAFYYSKLAQKPNATKDVDLSLAAVTLLRKAEELCLRHFGRSSRQYLEILLDLSRLYRRVDPACALKYLSESKKVCEESVFLANPENVISILTHETEYYLQVGNLCEAESALLSALAQLDSKLAVKTRKHLLRLQYELGFYLQKYKYCEEAVERLWAMSSSEKVEAVELAFKAALKESGLSESEGLIDENDSVRFEGRAKALVAIEAEKAEHGGLMELVAAAVEGRNVRLLTMMYFLSRC